MDAGEHVPIENLRQARDAAASSAMAIASLIADRSAGGSGWPRIAERRLERRVCARGAGAGPVLLPPGAQLMRAESQRDHATNTATAAAVRRV